MMNMLGNILRNMKNGELTLLNLTIMLAIFSLTATLFFTEGLRATLVDKTGMLLGGDRVITSPFNLDSIYNEKAKSLGLKTANTVTFLSMLVYKDDLALAEVKGVDQNYPLKGKLQGSSVLFAEDKDIENIPEPGTVWLETNLFTLLNVGIDDTIRIGEANFKVARLLTFEPDRGGQGLAFAPRALINIRDVEKTKVIQPGSRQTYKLSVTGDKNALDNFENFTRSKLSAVQSLKVAGKEQPILDNVFTQANYYLNIVLIINILFASVAVSQTMRRFSLRQYNTVAILRCFGAPFQWIIARITAKILLLGFVFAFIGLILGAVFFTLTRDAIETPLFVKIDMVWSIPVIAGFGCFLTLLLLFGLPPIFKLRTVSPLHILRKKTVKSMGDSAKLHGENKRKYFGFTDIINDKLLRNFPKLSVALKYGISNIFRYGSQNIIQTFAFSLVLTGAFILFFIHVDLMQSFRAKIPAKAPNFFAINIEGNDVKDFSETLNNAGIYTQNFYPVVRARLLSINNTPVSMDEGAASSASANSASTNSASESSASSNSTSNTSVSTRSTKEQPKRIPRLLNLSYVATLPPENEIVSGAFFTPENSGKPIVSIEQSFAERMNIHLNDELSFLIAEKTLKVKVASIRHVNWDSFNPNFFVLFPPNVLDNFPNTYMTSFHVDNNSRSILKKLVDRFPSVNLIDITMVLKQAEALIQTISKGIQFLLLCSGLMAMFMLFASLYSHLDERKQDALLFRILGASKYTLSKILLTEFALIGFCAGLIATIIAYLVYLWLAGSLFKIPTVYAWHWLGLGPFVGMVFIALLAWVMLRGVIRSSPKVLLTARRN